MIMTDRLSKVSMEVEREQVRSAKAFANQKFLSLA